MTFIWQKIVFVLWFNYQWGLVRTIYIYKIKTSIKKFFCVLEGIYEKWWKGKNFNWNKRIRKNGKINKSFKVKEIKKYKQKNKMIILNLVVYMIFLGAATFLTKILEKENLLFDNMIQHSLYTISLLLRGT